MPKRKAPKIINQEVIKAIQYLTNQDPFVTVTLGAIVERVNQRLERVENIRNLEKTIKETIYKLRDLGLIGYMGYNQYCCADCFANEQSEATAMPTPQPTPKPGQPDPAHFKPNPLKKSMPEKKSSLDPNRKHRNSEDPSTSALSGDEFEQTRKRFYGRKKIEKHNPNTPLPGARQVGTRKRTFSDICFSESTSEDEHQSTLMVKSSRPHLSKSTGAIIEEIPWYESGDSEIPSTSKRSKTLNGVILAKGGPTVPEELIVESVENVLVESVETGVEDNENENSKEKFENDDKGGSH